MDTKFWIIARRVHAGKSKTPLEKKFFELLNLLSQRDSVMFPVSSEIIKEISKQTPSRTLYETASLIDEISKGVALMNEKGRLAIESLDYWFNLIVDNLNLTTYLKTSDVVGLPVWTKIPFCCGFKIKLTKSDWLNKASFNEVWYRMGLKELLSLNFPNTNPIFEIDDSVAKNMNRDKFTQIHKFKSFKQIFKGILQTMILSSEPEIEEGHFFAIKRIGRNSYTPEQVDYLHNKGKAKKALTRRIYYDFRKGNIDQKLPYLHIISGLCSAIMWDKKRKFTNNDFSDFLHSTTALPYCDYFFTDSPMAHLIKQKNLAFDKLYNCKVVGGLEEAIEVLEKIERETRPKSQS